MTRRPHTPTPSTSSPKRRKHARGRQNNSRIYGQKRETKTRRPQNKTHTTTPRHSRRAPKPNTQDRQKRGRHRIPRPRRTEPPASSPFPLLSTIRKKKKPTPVPTAKEKTLKQPMSLRHPKRSRPSVRKETGTAAATVAAPKAQKRHAGRLFGVRVRCRRCSSFLLCGWERFLLSSAVARSASPVHQITRTTVK